MFAVFMELVKRVGIFVIIGQTILHFGISTKYEKYMKLVISFMVGAQIIFAFGVYVKQNDNVLPVLSLEEYLQAWDIHMEKMEENMEESRMLMLQEAGTEIQQTPKNSTVEIPLEKNHILIEKIEIP